MCCTFPSVSTWCIHLVSPSGACCQYFNLVHLAGIFTWYILPCVSTWCTSSGVSIWCMLPVFQPATSCWHFHLVQLALCLHLVYFKNQRLGFCERAQFWFRFQEVQYMLKVASWLMSLPNAGFQQTGVRCVNFHIWPWNINFTSWESIIFAFFATIGCNLDSSWLIVKWRWDLYRDSGWDCKR